MTRYRCVFPCRVVCAAHCNPGCDCAVCATLNSAQLEMAYEFESPDAEALESWLNERGFEPLSVTVMHEQTI